MANLRAGRKPKPKLRLAKPHPSHRPQPWLWLGVSACLLTSGGVAMAKPDLGKAERRIGEFETNLRTLGTGVQKPETVQRKLPADAVGRRLIDAEVNFGVGNYDDAAIVLYDIVERYPTYTAADEALYYLSESLFMKGDYVAAQNYYARLVKNIGPRSKFYRQSLERLIELTLKVVDGGANADQWFQLLDAVPDNEKHSSIPYVRGKYYFFTAAYDQALKQFLQVDAKSEYYLQARYFVGTCYVAQKDLVQASSTFDAITKSPATTEDGKRVIELAYMALARLHYERDQPSEAIDRYLQVSRKSDLFDEALYEVAWVYVKNKEYEKALRALELLALSDPLSSRLPEVKVLEGNLRIRKAQKANETGGGLAAEEFDKAESAFGLVRTSYEGPRDELRKVIDAKQDPRVFLTQITGRESSTFDVKSTLPEIAAAWLREEPEVKRSIGVENDLGQIDSDIQECDQTIWRIEQAISAGTKVNIFPALAEKKIRAIEMLDEMLALRVEFAKEGELLAKKHGTTGQLSELSAAQSARQAVEKEMSALPGANLRESARIADAKGKVIAVDKQASEVAATIDFTKAQLVAIEKYLADSKELGTEVKTTDLDQFQKEIAEIRTELSATDHEMTEARAQLISAQDQAGTGDDVARRRQELRSQLRVALDAEQKVLAGISGSGKDAETLRKMASLTARMNDLSGKLEGLDGGIDSVVDQALVEVRQALADERGQLSAFRQEYLNYDGESRTLGGTILGMAFKSVARKFYEVLIRADVGLVDVVWAVKESADGDSRRLALEQARERKVLDTEFAETLKEDATQAVESSKEDNKPEASSTDGAAAKPDEAGSAAGGNP